MITSINNTVSQKPSIIDAVIMQGYDKAPILSMIGTGTITAPSHSWINDRHEDPDDNANLEVSDFTGTMTPTKVKSTNNAQIIITEVALSDREIEMSQYGEKEWTFQVGKKGVRHTRDIEFALLGLGNTTIFDAPVDGTDVVEPRMAGFFHYVSAGQHQYFDTLGNGTGAAQSFTYAMLHTLLEPLYNNGAMEDDSFTMMMGTKIKQTINGWADSYLQKDNSDGKFDPTLWTISTDFGDVKLRLHRLFNTPALVDKVLVGQFNRARAMYVPNRKASFKEVPTSKTAKYARYVSDLTLEVRNGDYFASAEGLK